MSLPTLTFRTVTPEPCPVCKGECCRTIYLYRTVHMGAEYYTHDCEACVDGTKPLARPLTNDDLARAYDMGRDMERADTVAWLREEYDTDSTRMAADEIERGDHRRSPSTSPTGRSEPEPVPSDLALGKRIVACRGWRWTAGMIRRDGYRVCWRKPPPAFHEDDGVPDLSDEATLGCVVERLREVAEDPHLYLCAGGGDPETGVWHVRWGNNASRRGRTEAEALVRAWEALS